MTSLALSRLRTLHGWALLCSVGALAWVIWDGPEPLILYVPLALLAVAVLVVLGSRLDRARRRRFTLRDVRSALENVLNLDGAGWHDEWDMFLGGPPIDDPYLESVRQRCVRIWQEHSPEGPEAYSRLEPILEELSQRLPE